MFPRPTVKDIKFRNKTMLVRTDYNVPLKDGKITSDLRIRASLPTLEYLFENGAKRVIIMSHLGRPEGRDKSLSLKPIAKRLGELLPDHPVSFIDDVSGPDVEAAVRKVKKGGILMLENLRFFRGEEANSADFAGGIIESTHADYFVQDGFAVLHRAHASTSAIAHDLPSVAGLLVEKEVTSLMKLTDSPKHPFLVIIGGSKVADKQPLVDRFAKLADDIYVGGKIASDGYESKSKRIHVAQSFREDNDFLYKDISYSETDKVVDLINHSKTILWNGVLGEVENPDFMKSSVEVARAMGHKKDAVTIVCGGDTSGFVESRMTLDDSLSYTLVSTGGGASLEFLLNGTLPGLDALEG